MRIQPLALVLRTQCSHSIEIQLSVRCLLLMAIYNTTDSDVDRNNSIIISIYSCMSVIIFIYLNDLGLMRRQGCYFSCISVHQTNICQSPGLSPRLGLLRFEAGPEPTPSLHPGWALAGLERAGLGGLRA